VRLNRLYMIVLAVFASTVLSSCAKKETELGLIFVDYASLDGLDSFRLEHTWTWQWSDGEQGSAQVLAESVKDPFGQHVTVTSDDPSAAPMEFISFGATSYVLSSGEWVGMQMSSEQDLFELPQTKGPEQYLSRASAMGTMVGAETLDGLKTKHYRYSGDSFDLGDEFAQASESTADVWISTKQQVFVRIELGWVGTSKTHGEGEYSIVTRVYDINAPIIIDAPPDVEPPALPDDLPIMESARELALVSDLIYYQVDGATLKVAGFYRQEMVKQGWTLKEENNDSRYVYSKGDRLAEIALQTKGGVTLVTIAIRSQ